MLLDKKPDLDTRSVLYGRFKFKEPIPKWMQFVEEETTTKLPDNINLFCDVCWELKKEAQPFDLSQVRYLIKDLTREYLTLLPCRIYYSPKKKGAQFGVPNSKVSVYWAGQCSTCKVVYWAVEHRRPQNPIMCDLADETEGRLVKPIEVD